MFDYIINFIWNLIFPENFIYRGVKENLSIYSNNTNLLKVPEIKYIFRNSNNLINKYYWDGTNIYRYFYTDDCNEFGTVRNVVQELRLHSDEIIRFFNCLYISTILNENFTDISTLIGNYYIGVEFSLCVKEWFIDRNTVYDFFDNINEGLTYIPDLCIQHENEKGIVIFHHGIVGLYELFGKFCQYRETIEDLHVVVIHFKDFNIEYLHNDEFNFSSLKDKILFSNEKRKILLQETKIFQGQVNYWLKCNKAGQILHY